MIKDLKDLKLYFKDIYPHVWEHYKFLYDIRTKSKGFEFLLTFESLLLASFIALFDDFILKGEIIFLISLIAFFIAIFFSLYNLIPKYIWFPWFEKDDLKKSFEIRKDKDFYEEGVRSIYGVLDHLWEYDQRKGKLFFKNVLAMYIAIVLSFASVLIYYKLYIPVLVFVPVSVLFWALVQEGWGKELVKRNPAPAVEKFFDEWKKKVSEEK